MVTTIDLTGDCETFSQNTAGLLAFGWCLYFLVFIGTSAVMLERSPLNTKTTAKISLALSILGWFFYLCGWANYAHNVPEKCGFENSQFNAHKGPSFAFTVLSWIFLPALPCAIYKMMSDDGTEETESNPGGELELGDDVPIGGGDAPIGGQGGEAATQDESAKA